MKFPITLTPDTEVGGYVVSFQDIPEALTQGETVEECLKRGLDALESALGFYFEGRRAVPTPSQPKKGQDCVALPASLSAKVLLLNEMVRQNVRPADLARKMGTSPQNITRLTDPNHVTRIDGIEAALRALGRSLEMSVA